MYYSLGSGGYWDRTNEVLSHLVGDVTTPPPVEETTPTTSPGGTPTLLTLAPPDSCAELLDVSFQHPDTFSPSPPLTPMATKSTIRNSSLRDMPVASKNIDGCVLLMVVCCLWLCAVYVCRELQSGYSSNECKHYISFPAVDIVVV